MHSNTRSNKRRFFEEPLGTPLWAMEFLFFRPEGTRRKLATLYTEQMDVEGLGRTLLLTPAGDPHRAPEKQTVGSVTASHKMLTLQASSSSLNAGTAKRGCLGRGEAFGCPPAFCPPKRPRPLAHYRSTKATLGLARPFEWASSPKFACSPRWDRLRASASEKVGVLHQISSYQLRHLKPLILGQQNSAQRFSDRSFWKSLRLRVVDVRAFGSWMSAPKCLFFQYFEGPDRSFGPGHPRE